MIVPRTFSTPRRYHPGYSLLGRWLRRRVGDARQAEAVFIVALAGIGLGVLLAQYGAWALLQPALTADPTGPLAVVFWGVQLCVFTLVGLTCLLGFQPSVEVICTASGLSMRQGERHLTLAYEAIDDAEPLAPLLFHRHYRRYAATRAFVYRPTGALLLLHTADGPVVLGLLEADLTALHRHLDARLAPTYPQTRVA